ncbi:MAG: PhnD/SsuA/transferrin family substrate-binding protein [Gammaproteobacteria bacterium]|nr:PhnD/SsuA/transferrin family substrate-binding protein [Gammaproteobacteria bacterium]
MPPNSQSNKVGYQTICTTFRDNTAFLLYLIWPFLLLLLISIPNFANASSSSDSSDIKMVVTAAFVSERGLPIYTQVANYLSSKLNRNVDVISGISYEESNLLLQQGIIQVGFICGLPFTREFNENDLIAMPVMATSKGDAPDIPGYDNVPGKYFSYTIVHKDSPIKSWQDLKGKTYVYNDINSNSGYNMPRYKLLQLGAKSWEDYFSKISVSGSHEESIRLVSQGIVDASSVDSLVLDYDRHIGNQDALNVRVIESLFPKGAGAPPVVLSKHANPELRQKIQNILINMHEDITGRMILDKALIKYFEKPDNANYDDIRHMDNAAKAANFKDHQE